MNSLQGLYEVVKHRRENYQDDSYTCYLFEKGIDKILKKCGEECAELIIAAKNNDKQEIKNEAADLIYHMLVLLVDRGVQWSEIEEILEERRAKIGNLKNFHIVDKDS